MDRLTENNWQNLDPWECCGQDRYCRKENYAPGGCNNGCVIPKLYSRLAAYEDTGITPEEVMQLKRERDALIGKIPHDCDNCAHWRPETLTPCAAPREAGPCRPIYREAWQWRGLNTPKNHGQWISVKDRLPEGDCIVYEANSGNVLIAREDEWTAVDWDVTHWMPLPEPPEEANHDTRC